ncbi:hypothetical protein THEYE_A2021 [Thermodesulfovibrio yellowstonii DSM 11347]|uniref:Uncharacterized protein n=1 Tax=Thermodesulfovibrio yellowstonii (strain ATCC 51303 / DSM 11347 / YP87) TaxID=289376 RepID=B5YIT4_THEYD|nr:hypothetical protein THEYE_A2021 [Thermodesulfovibrio yellowstonii DSM 11347]
MNLYIPHGSDETNLKLKFLMMISLLYIPHGSDETATTAVKDKKVISALYPTWFR